MPDDVRPADRTPSSAQLQRLIDNLADTAVSTEKRQATTDSLLNAWLGTKFQCAPQAHRLLNHIVELNGKAWDPMRNALMAALRPAMQQHSPQVTAGDSLARHARHERALRDLTHSKVLAFAQDKGLTERQRFDLKHKVDQRLREALLGDLATLTYAELGSEACLTEASTAQAYLAFEHLPELIERLRHYEVSERCAPVPELPEGLRLGAIEDFLRAVYPDLAHGVQDANAPTRIKFSQFVSRVFSYAQMETLTQFFTSPEGQDYRELRSDVAEEILGRGEDLIDAEIAAWSPQAAN